MPTMSESEPVGSSGADWERERLGRRCGELMWEKGGVANPGWRDGALAAKFRGREESGALWFLPH